MNNIFIIVSPLQLLNCMEAQHFFKTKNNILIIFKTGELKSFNQILELLKISHWDKIIYIDFPTKFIKNISYPYLIKKSLNKEGIEKIFVGEYRSIHINHLVNFLKIESIYLVDDGMSTLSYDKFNRSNNIKNSIKHFIYKMFFYKTKNITYTFFTCFNINNKKTIKNEYNMINQYKKNSKHNDSIFFIGQPLVELGVINKKIFKEYLIQIVSFFKKRNNEFIFILHRNNNKIMIEELSLELGFTYLEFNNLLEVEMIKREILPSTISTFYSTGIYNLSNMFKNMEYIVFKIEKENINKKILPILDIEKYYREFDKLNIKIERLITKKEVSR